MKKLILPGLIDPHVHLRDLEQTQKEDFYTGTCAAVAGGYTTVIDMPNNQNPITTYHLLKEKINAAKVKTICDIGFFFGSLGDNLTELEQVKHLVFGVKLYLNITTGNFLIDEERLEKIYQSVPKDMLILVHAEDETIEQVIKIARKYKKKTHICHISTKWELEKISKAKNEGFPVTCGVTPHHLFLNEQDVKTLGPFGKMKPSLKSKKDVKFLWKNLDKIDVIESDHAPHTIGEKQSGIIPYGVPGIETTLPLMLTAVSEQRLALERVIEMCYENPARIFGIKKDPKTWVEIDNNKTYCINNNNLFTKCKWSPFNNWKVKGKVLRTFIRAEKVYEDGKILAKPGSGRILEKSV
ncbi:MAG: amidohydrolase family protein [bacterium]|nr:amidohydrolase family protein [bacterium]